VREITLFPASIYLIYKQTQFGFHFKIWQDKWAQSVRSIGIVFSDKERCCSRKFRKGNTLLWRHWRIYQSQ